MGEAGRAARDPFIDWRTDVVGVAMVACGLFFLLVNFGVVRVSAFFLSRALGSLFITAGLAFLFFQGAGGGLFWFILPTGLSFSLGFLTMLMGFDRLLTLETAALLSAGAGLTFLAVFLSRKNHWWALITTGACIGVAGWLGGSSLIPVIGLHPVFPLFFTGLSFLAIYLSFVMKRKLRWSLITGAVLVASSLGYLLILLLSRWEMLWPAILLLVGVAIPVTLKVAGAGRRTRGAP
jgi:hypothetical protein